MGIDKKTEQRGQGKDGRSVCISVARWLKCKIAATSLKSRKKSPTPKTEGEKVDRRSKYRIFLLHFEPISGNFR